MTERAVQRGTWLLEPMRDGTVGLIMVPESGAPAGCAMTAVEAATLAVELWACASALRHPEEVKKPRAKRETGG